MTNDTSQDIRDRTFRFGCEVARLSLALAPQPGVRCIIDQLLKAGTGVGANLEEAKAASSKREFVRYVEISLREAREAVYWIRVCAELQLGPVHELTRLRAEGDQISRILGAIAISAKRRMIAGHALFAFGILHFALFLSS